MKAALAASIGLLLAACATTESPSSLRLRLAGAEPTFFSQARISARLDSEAEVALELITHDDLAMPDPQDELAEVVVYASPRAQAIRNLVDEASLLLQGVELDYVFTGTGRNELLRGRPVAFALWSDRTLDWTIARVEIPRPPIRWRPGRAPLPIRSLTPGIVAEHVKGTGAERLMMAFSRDGEPLRVYGRKFPVFDNTLIRRRQWRAVAAAAEPIIYLPFTEDALDPLIVEDGRAFLLATATRAIEEIRAAGIPSRAFPGEAMADVVPATVLATLAVIEQTDDGDYREKGTEAFDEVLNQYGLKHGEAYRYSVSSASAIGPMQFTNRRGNGTYAMVVRSCPAARIDPDFLRGATNLLNAMKAAICLFDIELARMGSEIRRAYMDNREVLGIFPVAAYNGGQRNVSRLGRAIRNMRVDLADLRQPGEQPADREVPCPCLWKQSPAGVVPVSIPRYNNENRWYIEKYQSILGEFD